MRRFSAFLLALVIASQAFYNAGVTLYWLANRAYIAAELCINRDKPALQCDGKCYLKKKIAEAPDTAPASDSNLKFEKSLDLADVSPDEAVCLLPPPSAARPALIPGQKNALGSLLAGGVFHPPPQQV